ESPLDVRGFPLLTDVLYDAATGTGPVVVSGTGAFASPETITTPGSGLVFVNTNGAGVTTNFHNAIVAAETYLESHFTNSVTINASFDLQQLNQAFSGQNQFGLVSTTYNQLVGALQAHTITPDDFKAVTKLLNTPDPSGGGGNTPIFLIPNSYAKML